MRIILECDGKEVSYSQEDSFTNFLEEFGILDNDNDDEVNTVDESEITWGFLLTKFIGLLTVHGYYIPYEKILKAIDSISKEELMGFITKDSNEETKENNNSKEGDGSK